LPLLRRKSKTPLSLLGKNSKEVTGRRKIFDISYKHCSISIPVKTNVVKYIHDKKKARSTKSTRSKKNKRKSRNTEKRLSRAT